LCQGLRNLRWVWPLRVTAKLERAGARNGDTVLSTILLIILILIVVGALPTWGYSRSWGYGPSGIGGVLVLILIILLLTGRI
jgi:fumarate reductase subunit D